MRRKSICPECHSESVLFQEIYRKAPITYRVLALILGLFCGAMAVRLIPNDLSSIWRLIATAMCFVFMYVGLFSKAKTLTAIRFRCQDCQHEFLVEDPQLKQARKWPALSPSSWREVSVNQLPPYAL